MHSEMRGSLDRHLPRSLPTEDELFAMRRAAWRQAGDRGDQARRRPRRLHRGRPWSTRRRASTASGRWHDGAAQAENARQRASSPACR